MLQKRKLGSKRMGSSERSRFLHCPSRDSALLANMQFDIVPQYGWDNRQRLIRPRDRMSADGVERRRDNSELLLLRC